MNPPSGQAAAAAHRLARPLQRVLGFVIDITSGVALGALFVRGLSPREQTDVGPIFLLITPFYFVMLPEAMFGRSMGKLLTGTKVVGLVGGKPGWGRAFLRMIVRVIPFEFLSFKNGVMWHDRFTGTRVVRS